MAFGFTWQWYNGASWQNFSAGNLVGFYGTTTFGDQISVGQYQDGMHLRTSSDTNTDACASPHLSNIKYLGTSLCSISGGSSTNVTNISQTDCIRILFTDGSNAISTENAKFYAYDGTTESAPPTSITMKALEQGDSVWSTIAGSGTYLGLADQASAINHYFYIALSASPNTSGDKTAFAFKVELDYY